MDELLKRDPNNASALTQRAEIYVGQLKFTEAIADYDKVISMSENNEAVYAARGYCHLRMYLDISATAANLNLAKSDAEKTLELNPNNSLALGIRGLARYVAKDKAGASSDAEKALQLNSKSILGYMIRGLIILNTKKSDGTYDKNAALEEFDKAYKIVPQDEWVEYWRDWSGLRGSSPLALAIKAEYAKQEEIEKKAKIGDALSRLEAAKQKVLANPWDYNSYVQLNNIFDQAKIKRDEFYEKIVRENPSNICAVLFLGEIHFYRPNLQIQAYEDLFRKYDGKNGTLCAANIATRISTAYAGLNKFKEAKVYIDKAKELSPNASFVADAAKYYETNLADDQAVQKVFDNAPINRQQPGNKNLADSGRLQQAVKELEVVSKQWNGHFTTFNNLNAKLKAAEGDSTTISLQMKKELEASIKLQSDYLTNYERTVLNAAENTTNPDIVTFANAIKQIRRQMEANKLKVVQLGKANEVLADIDAKDKKLSEAQKDYKEILEHYLAVDNLKDKLKADNANAKTYVTQMKRETETIIRLSIDFLSKYENKLEKTGLKRRDDVIDMLNQEMANMREEIERLKENIKLFDTLI